MDPRQRALDALFRAPGSAAANYFLASGLYTPIRVIISQPDQTVRLGQGKVVAGSVSIEIRRSEIAKPASGETITLIGTTAGREEQGAVSFRVHGEPTLDTEGMTWTCAAVPLP